MSKFADDSAFAFKRQFREIEVPGKGSLLIQTLSGAETGPIQAAQQRFMVASLGKDVDKASKAALQVAIETISAGVVDENHQKRWEGKEGKQFIASWGAADQEFVAAEINRFNDLEALTDLENAAKNSAAMNGDSSTSD